MAEDSDLEVVEIPQKSSLWELNIGEVTGHSIEASVRDEVNEMLADGWLLLHIYTLKYRENGTWRERPMAILGKRRDAVQGSSIAVK